MAGRLPRWFLRPAKVDTQRWAPSGSPPPLRGFGARESDGSIYIVAGAGKPSIHPARGLATGGTGAAVRSPVGVNERGGPPNAQSAPRPHSCFLALVDGRARAVAFLALHAMRISCWPFWRDGAAKQEGLGPIRPLNPLKLPGPLGL